MPTKIGYHNYTKRLGKKEYKHDDRTLRLSKYIHKLPPAPEQSGYIDKIAEWPMMLNDSIGNCTVATAGHMVQQWTTYAGNPDVPSDPEILRAYSQITGYNPNIPDSDTGAYVLDVLKYWRKIGIGGHKIVAFVRCTGVEEVKQAINLFGNCYLGVGLPITASDPVQGVNGYPCWSLPAPNDQSGAPWSWGGHAVPAVGYGHDRKGNTGCMVVTWGQLYDMTWGFFKRYCDEAWAVLSQDWFDRDGLSPSGFDIDTLKRDLEVIGQ